MFQLTSSCLQRHSCIQTRLLFFHPQHIYTYIAHSFKLLIIQSQQNSIYTMYTTLKNVHKSKSVFQASWFPKIISPTVSLIHVQSRYPLSCHGLSLFFNFVIYTFLGRKRSSTILFKSICLSWYLLLAARSSL